MVRPSFFVPSLSQLAASMLHLASVAEGGLRQLAGMDPQSASVLTTGVARYGKLMLVSCDCCLVCVCVSRTVVCMLGIERQLQRSVRCKSCWLHRFAVLALLSKTILLTLDVAHGGPSCPHTTPCCSAPPAAFGRMWGRWLSSNASGHRLRWVWCG